MSSLKVERFWYLLITNSVYNSHNGSETYVKYFIIYIGVGYIVWRMHAKVEKGDFSTSSSIGLGVFWNFFESCNFYVLQHIFVKILKTLNLSQSGQALKTSAL